MAVRVGLLGPLRLESDDGAEVRVGAAKERSVLALLALRAPGAVRTEELIEALWGESPPATAVKTVQNYVSALRKILGADVLQTTDGGYQLHVDSSGVDVKVFEQHVVDAAKARVNGHLIRARELLQAGLGLWRGDPLVDLADQPSGMAEAVRLNELRRAATEDLADVGLQVGDHAALVGDLEAAVAAEPLRERRWAQLMLALYRSGRQADALRTYQRLRAVLGDELGLEPSIEVRQLESDIAAQSPTLNLSPFSNRPGPALRAPSGNVTFVFSDIEGSTRLLSRLGPQTYAGLLEAHQQIIRTSISASGGREVDTQGDSFFVAFDNAYDAIAACVDIQRTLAQHPWPDGDAIRVRIGVHTGIATPTADGRYVAMAVHRAARIAATAHGGQTVLSQTTADLVADTLPSGVTVRDLGLHRLKDMAGPEQIWQVCAEGLSCEFPPLRSLDNPALRNNLPSLPGRFIGRVSELAKVCGLLNSNRLVTLTGAGGTGKTRLALHAAAEMLDGSCDGVWLVELAAVTDPTLVATSICDAIGISAQPGRLPLDVLIDALAVQDLLLVLDNCEHLIDICAKTADLILRSCPKAHLLATSREPLGIGGETIYRVPTLSLPQADNAPETADTSDAVTLFIDRGEAQGIDLPVDVDSRKLVAGICQQLDGLPLAIELAAARLSSLSLREISQRLEHRFRLLTGGSRSALERHQTLRATVEWSYSLLNSAERSALNRLSIFVGSFDLDAADTVCDGSGFDIADLVGSLVDKSLLIAEPVAGTMRYRMLETIRQYSAERLIEAGGDESERTAESHCLYYLALAETAANYLTGRHQVEWITRLDADQANIRRALEYAADNSGATPLVFRFAVALFRYWTLKQLDGDALEFVGPVLDRPDALSDPDLFGEALFVVAGLTRFSEPTTKQQRCAQMLDFARRRGDDRLLARALALNAMLRLSEAEWTDAMAFSEEAVDLARSLHDDQLLPEVLVPYLICIQTEDNARVEELYKEALSCAERTLDLFSSFALLCNAGSHSLLKGDLVTARSRLLETEKLGRELQVLGHFQLVPRLNLAWVAREEGEIDRSKILFEEILTSVRQQGLRGELAAATLGLACIATDTGDWDQASLLHGIAQALIEMLGIAWQPPEDTYHQRSLGKLFTHFGKDRYQSHYQRAREFTFEDALTEIFDSVAAR